MCDIAPFQMECLCEGVNTASCSVHKLNCVLTELLQEIPFMGKYVPNYRCPDFEIPGGTEND